MVSKCFVKLHHEAYNCREPIAATCECVMSSWLTAFGPFRPGASPRTRMTADEVTNSYPLNILFGHTYYNSFSFRADKWLGKKHSNIFRGYLSLRPLPEMVGGSVLCVLCTGFIQSSAHLLLSFMPSTARKLYLKTYRSFSRKGKCSGPNVTLVSARWTLLGTMNLFDFTFASNRFSPSK